MNKQHPRLTTSRSQTHNPEGKYWRGDNADNGIGIIEWMRNHRVGAAVLAVVLSSLAIAGSVRAHNGSEDAQERRHIAAAETFAAECETATGTLVIAEGASIRSTPHAMGENNLIEVASETTTRENVLVYLCQDADGTWTVTDETTVDGITDPSGPFNGEDDGFIAVNLGSDTGSNFKKNT